MALSVIEKDFLEQLDAPAFYLDTKACFVYGNRPFYNMTDAPLEQMQGSCLHEMAEIIGWQTDLKPLCQRIEDGLIERELLAIRGNDQQTSLATVPIMSNGNPVGYYCLLPRPLASEPSASGILSAQQFMGILPNMPATIGALDDQLRIIAVNSLAPGLDPKAIMGKSAIDFLSEADRGRVEATMRDALATGEPRAYTTTSLATGLPKRRLTWIRASDVESLGRILHLVSIDITEQQSRENLLEAARDEAEAANRAKSTFIANMSHELRTPLNSILGYTDMLLAQGDRLERDRVADVLGKVQQAGHHLLELIGDVIDLSKIEAGRLELKPAVFSLNGLGTEIGSMAQPLAEKNENTFSLTAPTEALPFNGDLLRIRQIVFNLVANACKFTHNEQITATLQLSSFNNRNCLFFEVRDKGIGMTEEQLERVFDIFSQADTRIASQYGGAGLGLAISKQLCELMGGTIEAESHPGEGSVFRVRLPEAGVAT